MIIAFPALAGTSAQNDIRTSVILSAKWVRFVNGVLKQTCVKTYSDGRYVLEKTESARNTTVDSYDSVLSDAEIAQLSLIIDNGDFKMLSTPGNTARLTAIGQDGQLLMVQVSRANEVQGLAVSSDGKQSLPPAVIPLLKWIKDIKPDKSSRIINGKPSLCMLVQ